MNQGDLKWELTLKNKYQTPWYQTGPQLYCCIFRPAFKCFHTQTMVDIFFFHVLVCCCKILMKKVEKRGKNAHFLPISKTPIDTNCKSMILTGENTFSGKKSYEKIVKTCLPRFHHFGIKTLQNRVKNIEKEDFDQVSCTIAHESRLKNIQNSTIS